MRIPLDTVWAIEPGAWRNIEAAIRSGLPEAAAQTDDANEGTERRIGNVSLIRIGGVITKNPSFFTRWFGDTSTLEVEAAVKRAASDPEVRTILFQIDSPGGSVDGLAELGDTIFAARDRKQVIAQVTGMAASAAYYLASQADKVYAQRMDLIGSIGTRLMLYDFSRLFANEGIEAVPIDTGEHKSAGAMGTEITESQRAEFQKIVNLYFEDFLKVVRRGRDIGSAALQKIADGRLFGAVEARGLGLIDGVRTMDETMARLQSRRQRNIRQQALAELQLDTG